MRSYLWGLEAVELRPRCRGSCVGCTPRVSPSGLSYLPGGPPRCPESTCHASVVAVVLPTIHGYNASVLVAHALLSWKRWHCLNLFLSGRPYVFVFLRVGLKPQGLKHVAHHITKPASRLLGCLLVLPGTGAEKSGAGIGPHTCTGRPAYQHTSGFAQVFCRPGTGQADVACTPAVLARAAALCRLLLAGWWHAVPAHRQHPP